MEIKPVHKASCHCGSMKFEVSLPNGLVEPRRCNCSMCRRRRAIIASLFGGGSVRLLGALDRLMYTSRPKFSGYPGKGGVPWRNLKTSIHFPFERTSKRRKGFPSETQVKRGQRVVGGEKYLVEKLGRNDLCPCGSGRRFQEVLFASKAVRGFCSGRLLLDNVLSAPNQLKQSDAEGAMRLRRRCSRR